MAYWLDLDQARQEQERRRRCQNDKQNHQANLNRRIPAIDLFLRLAHPALPSRVVIRYLCNYDESGTDFVRCVTGMFRN